jgi:CXCXC repeat
VQPLANLGGADESRPFGRRQPVSPEAREQSFDELARGLASGEVSRGKALRLMGAALVGGALGSLGMREAGADLCKRAGKACKKNSQCCSGNCVNAPTGTCAACPSGQVLCNNGSCVSNSCLANSGQVFNSSTCQCECPSGRVLLSNGTCALPCTGTISRECPADCGSFGGGSCAEANAGGLFCRGDVVGLCAPDGGCPTGSFCRGGACVEAC